MARHSCSFVTCAVFILVSVVKSSHIFLNEYRFIKNSICNVGARIAEGCSKEVVDGHSKYKCLGKCAREDSCKGFSLDATGKCFHHEICLSIDPCTGNDAGHNYWAKYCVSSSRDSMTDSCTCYNAGSGARCAYPTDCDGLTYAGYPKGRYLTYIDPFKDGREPLHILCYVNNLYDLVTVAKNTGRMNFNRTWKEYENGFHLDTNNHWIGLKTWHALNSIGYNRLVIALFFRQNVNMYSDYHGYNLSGRNDGYRLTYAFRKAYHVGSIPGMAYNGNCLLYALDQPFSTWDRDNDGDNGVNCASLSGYAWWFSGCDNKCTLLGWGLDNWYSTPPAQRLSHLGVDMDVAYSLIEHVEIYTRLGD